MLSSLYSNILFIAVFLFFSSCKQNDTAGSSADRIYINAVIWTGDLANAKATSIAIKDSVIMYVGDDHNSYKGESTEIIDLAGKMMVPGFIDNHTHFLSGGYQLASVNLRAAKTPVEFIAILKKYVSGLPDKRWIQGGDWDHEAWGGALPTRKWIDSVTGNNPLFVSRYDGHMALANSVTLQLAGIDKNTLHPAFE